MPGALLTDARLRETLMAGLLGLAPLALTVAPTRALANPDPPTVVEVPEAPGPARVPGDAEPKSRSPLPVYKAPRPTARTQAATPVVAAPVTRPAVRAKAVPRPDKPARGVQQQIELTGGYAVLPSSWLTLLGKVFPDGEPGSRNRHPAVTAVTIDAAWWRPVSRRTFFAARFGVAIPLVPDANWYSSTGQPAPLYTQVNLALLDVAAEYGVHVPVHPRVALSGRVGLGLAILAGTVPQTETIPTCTKAQAASCPHWRQVGKENAPLPPVLPTARLTAGVQVQVADDWQLALDGGVRSGLYGGLGVLRRF